jgi:OmcA/MtrC family decaheme c-type cytochrome
MNINRSFYQWFGLAVGVLTIALAGCTGDSGSTGSTGTPGATVGVASLADATSLNMSITGVTVNSPPVVNFSLTNQDGVAVAGLTDADLRFDIAKLNPGTNGAPSTWQNYIVRASGGAMQGSQERYRAQQDYPWGQLVDHKDGTYTYTFCTNIKDSSGTPSTQNYANCPAPQPNYCPPPCTDADGNALDISYQPTLTTRVGIQMSNSAYPKVNATYDFVPAGGPVTTERVIVQLANCNECHNQLTAHGSRIDTKLCVTCHNPGSWVAAGSGQPNRTVDFKVMIHKIHRGEELPSVVAGTPYKIGNSNFSDVVFPQDIRNCTKCHTNTDTVVARNAPQGDNWEAKPSVAACGSCHDDIDFGASGPPAGSVPNGHPGGDLSVAGGGYETDSTVCLGCHVSTGAFGIAKVHSFPALLLAESAKYKLNVVSVTNSSPGSAPTITFSITDPTNGNAAYDIANTPAITGGSMSLLVGWKSLEPSTSTIMPIDFNNSGISGSPNPVSISLLSGGALAGSVTDNGNGTYSVTSSTAIPLGTPGSGRVGFYARMSVDVDADGTKDTIQVKSAVKDFSIDGNPVVARRTVVDIAKCDKCHQQLSLHGGARTDEPQLCVMCHNPDNTDISRRPALVADTLDGKAEEAIDFKRLIHGIHAGAQTHYDGSAGHGFRTKGLVVWGYPGAASCFDATSGEYTCQNDFSDVRFPGILNDCSTCHVGTSYQLTGVWENPTGSGILASTVDHGASLTDPADDLNISPTAAACTSCHDDTTDPALWHLKTLGNAKWFDPTTQTDDFATQATINSSPELCVTCHGPGSIKDVQVVHSVP